MACVDGEVSAVPVWERKLAFAVAAHDVIVAGDRLLGRVSPQYEGAQGCLSPS